MALTRRQKEVMDFLSSFIEKHGYSPSYEEIASGLGLASLATVHKHVQALEAKHHRGESTGSGGPTVGPSPKRDETLQDPSCVFQVLKRHYSRYTPEVVEQICGIPQDLFLKVCQELEENSGRDRTSAILASPTQVQRTAFDLLGVRITA